MILNGLNGIEFIEAAYKSDASLKGTTKITSIEGDNSNTGFKKYLTDDKKNSLVSTNSESQNSNYNYDLKLLSNTPAAALNSLDKILQRQIKEKDFYRTYLRFTEENINDDDYEATSDKVGKGFYIVLNSPEDKNSVKKIKKFVSPFLERVKETYGLILKKEPGALVDLTY